MAGQVDEIIYEINNILYRVENLRKLLKESSYENTNSVFHNNDEKIKLFRSVEHSINNYVQSRPEISIPISEIIYILGANFNLYLENALNAYMKNVDY